MRPGWAKWLRLLLSLFMISGCQLLGPKNVEVVVPQKELGGGGGWVLSPAGDKVIYRSRDEKNERNIVLVFLSRQETYVIEDLTGKYCYAATFLDNTNLYCEENHRRKPYIFATDDFREIRLQEIKAADIDLELRLSAAEIIYRPSPDKMPYFADTLIVLGDNYKHNPEANYLITEIADSETALAGYDYITFPPVRDVATGQKIYSPDGRYYYHLESDIRVKVKKRYATIDRLSIHDAHTDKKLTEYETRKDLHISVKGWGSDSSGVYFQLFSMGFTGREQGGIQKLKVPQ